MLKKIHSDTSLSAGLFYINERPFPLLVVDHAPEKFETQGFFKNTKMNLDILPEADGSFKIIICGDAIFSVDGGDVPQFSTVGKLTEKGSENFRMRYYDKSDSWYLAVGNDPLYFLNIQKTDGRILSVQGIRREIFFSISNKESEV